MACSVDTALLGMMSPEEIEAMEKAKAKKRRELLVAVVEIYPSLKVR